MKRFILGSFLLPLLFSLSGCFLQDSSSESNLQLTETAGALPPLQAATATPAPSPTPARYTLWISQDLPDAFRDFPLSTPFSIARDKDTADFVLDVGGSPVTGIWTYVLVAAFPTLRQEVTSTELLQAWSDASSHQTLLVSLGTAAVMERHFRRPASINVKTLSEDKLLQAAWDDRLAWALIPFETLDPRWKVLEVDGQSPLHKDFSPEKYPLNVVFGLSDTSEEANLLSRQVLAGYSGEVLSNRDSKKLTTVILTGVTALVRATANLMEYKGLTYPGEALRPMLSEADILHVNNEIPFTPGCPPPFMRENNLVFCSKPEYLDLLKDIGADVVELSGDHFFDWGPDAMLYTIDLYEKNGIQYYGGGKNLADGQKPFLIEHNGNQLAFLGCNAKPKGYATASENNPGAVHCNFPYLEQEISRLRKDGYLPIVTFQHLEYYSYEINPILKTDFEGVARAGAVVVSGSQAHQPHGMEFFQASFLHYGLGNLFFDQYKEGIPQRQAFVDRHVFYDGKYISSELIPIIFIDQAKARPMTPEESENLLMTVFKASGW